MAGNDAGARESFIIPGRTLQGSRQEMVQDIDQAIVGLLALRHLIGAVDDPARAFDVQRKGRPALGRAWDWLVQLPARLAGTRNGRDAGDAP
jgi:hypothetical protein